MRTASLWKATALAVPLGLAGFGAHAADIVGTAQQEGFNTFAKAVEAAGMTDAFKNGGPYTVFAPTDQAFKQLPQGALDELMKQENQDQLKTLLQHHVVEGKEIKASQVIGQQTEVDTLSGDRLTVDGTGQTVLLVPTGLTITRVGDRVFVEREVAAVTAPAVEVESQAGQKSGQGQQASQASDQGQSQGQQQAQSGQQSESQQQAQSGNQGSAQTSGGSAARTQVSQQGDMPISEHQQQALKSDPQQAQQQTAPQGTAMPATEHQRQVLAEGEMPSKQQQSSHQARGQGTSDVLREATVVQPDIQADNGVIHGVDAVLVPEKLLSKFEDMQNQSQQSSQGQQPGQTQQGQAKQG